MSAVLRVTAAAVRRRRIQSLILAVAVLCSTVAIVVALGLLEAASGPFERSFARQNGAHVVAAFDRAAVSDEQLAGTTQAAGVKAAAGPFAQSTVTVRDIGQSLPSGPLTVVGRPGPDGPVDRVNLWAGRWASEPGEIVVSRPYEPFFRDMVGTAVELEGGPKLTIVGLAASTSATAEAWVTPAQMAALRPSSTQMLYRFHDAGDEVALRAAMAKVTADLPSSALLSVQTHLTVKREFAQTASVYLPFLTGFGLLGMVVAVLIVANVISGAVIAGMRHIGILKSLGFTPNQVLMVYLGMVLIPGLVGCVVGTVLGGLAARPLLRLVFQGLGSDIGLGLGPWVYAAALLGVPSVVVLAAVLPAMRAHRLSAAETISAGSAPRPGRGQRVQRLLAGTRLPRSVSLGLGLPFARPGRSALTMAVMLLGVTAVTLASGLVQTMSAYGDAAHRIGYVHTVVHVGRPDQTRPKLDDAGIEALLRSMPGTKYVTADAWIDIRLQGHPGEVQAQFLRGDFATRGDVIVRGRGLSGAAGEVVAPSAFLNKQGLRVGDRLTLMLNGARTSATIVGESLSSENNRIMASWPTLTALAPGQKPTQYEVRLAPGVDVDRFNAAVKKADPGLYPMAQPETDQNSVAVISASLLFTLLLSAVAALGVFNTVVLNTRDRRRDLGMLKAIGMTPRQVTAMMVVSMAALGTVGGLFGIPLGMALHRLIVRTMADAAGLTPAPFLVDVWQPAGLAALVLAGTAIAMLGAFIPARNAARLTIANALHTE